MPRLLPLFAASCVAAALSPTGASAGDPAAVSLASYRVSARVRSRLAKTSVDMVLENSADCGAVHGLTLQLPRGARVTDLLMDLSDGCRLESDVKALGEAVEDFEAFSSEGKAAALLTAWDMSNYELQVSVPPNGTARVLLEYQELLFQKLDRVSFQVPVFPGISVDDLKVDVAVEEPVAGVVEFQTDLRDNASEAILDGNKATMHYEERGVAVGTSLPTLLQAHFRPGPLPGDGLFFSDGECFTHVLNPATILSGAGPMAKKIVFVIDVSGSMSGQKLEDAKASFAVMIDTLDERDTFIVQPFSDEGTEDKWGPRSADAASRDDAKSYVMGLETIGGTNLNQAFLDGIANVRDAPAAAAPILVALTDGQGNSGARDVARNVRGANEGGRVKIFSLAFGDYADIDLLLGIAIQNGGRAVRIYEGFGDAAAQMELFYKRELGTVLMSDVGVSYDFGDIAVLESTAQQFPVYAAGSEIVVRGRMDAAAAANASRGLASVVSANSAAGPKQWAVDHVLLPDNSGGDCRQSFAQARIVELLEYSDAERALGDELFLTAVRSRSLAAAPSFEEEARTIALDARLVWPGLTALVTAGNAGCRQNSSKVCYSGNGDGGDSYYGEDRSEGASAGGSGNMMASPQGSPTGGSQLSGSYKSEASCGWSGCFFSLSLLLLVVLSLIVLTC